MHLPAFLQHLQRRQNTNALSSFLNSLTGSSDDDDVVTTTQRAATTNAAARSTVVSVVFVTASPTFTGPTASLVTATPTKAATTAAATTAAATTKAVQTTQAAQTTQNTGPTVDAPRAAISSATTSTAASQIAGTALSTSRQQTTSTQLPTAARTTGTINSATASPSATPTDAPSAGMSGGAKAGVAFGVILAFALVGGLIFFFIRRKKQQKKEEDYGHNLDNEKTFFAHGGSNQPSTNNSRAPRLSLRPVTQFLPGVGEPKVTEMTSATGFPQPYFSAANNNGRGAPRSGTSMSSHNDAANPFGAHAEKLDNVAADRAAENAPIPVPAMSPRAYGSPNPSSSPAANPFADARPVSPDETPASLRPGSPVKSDAGSAVVAAGAGAAVVAGGAAAATGSQTPPPNNVHRVQLDFKPSMEDELELRGGQVVRLLHEYDDGWALCQYMDRSRQGVAPRTCLSKMPVKPRPAGPPPGMRPMGRPQSPGMRPQSPGMRAPSPGMRNYGTPGQGPNASMYPAPLSPATSSMSLDERRARGPGSPPNGRMRSMSQSQSLDGRQGSPQMRPNGFGGPGSAPRAQQSRDHRRSASMGQLARKPVPGQAM